jgi:serine/threonine protein kinase
MIAPPTLFQPPPLSPHALEELSQAGFDVLKEIGRGGMGIVFRAQQRADDRIVALKVLPLAGIESPTLEKRFDLEAEIGRYLNHPDIVAVHSAGRGKHAAWIAMELLSGFDLTSAIDDPKFSVDERIQVLLRTALALHHAHEQRVIHRDVKPSNIFLTGDGRVKLLDFGVAKLADLSITQTGQLCGTPSYMAPEQVMSQPLTPATDIFALGVVAFRTFAPIMPWDAESPHALLMAICVMPPKLFRDAVRADNRFGLSAEQIETLHAIIHRAIEAEPTRRFGSAFELGEAFEQFLLGKTPAPRAPEATGHWSTHRVEWARARAARLELESKERAAAPLETAADAGEEEERSLPLLYLVLFAAFGVGLAVVAWLLYTST